MTKDELLKLVRERVHHPSTVRDLMRTLKIPRQGRVTLKRHLDTLVTDGSLVQIRGNRYGVPDKMDLIVGRLQTSPAGFGFVVPERPLDDAKGDVFVAAPNLLEATHGDRVLVRIERYREDRRPEGRIVRILERASASIVGRYEQDDGGPGVVVPFDRRVLMDVQILQGDARDARSGQMVTVEITRWPTATRPARGRVVEVLGALDEPGVDIKIILRKHAIPDEHGPEAVAEAERLAVQSQLSGEGDIRLSDRDRAGRTDFRGQTTVTIDGEHARDFDDAVSIERLPGGGFRLSVHIADVSHYVQEESPLDVEAYDRGTSVYFPDRAVHMFPEALATGICSLRPRVDRLVQTCIMDVDRQGTVVHREFHDGIIRTAERMTYTDVNAIVALKDAEAIKRYEALVPAFEMMIELFEILHDRRRRRGSIDFDLSETEVVLDSAGLVEAILPAQRNVAHRIIEEFMLLANETVAAFFDERGGPGMYRIHEEPDPLKVAEFEEFISGFGYSLGAPPASLRPRHFQRLIERIEGKPEEKPIAFLMLRTMQRARYSEQNAGHFGLAARTYTHFTSPIRRYPDLIVHRLLRELRHGSVSVERREELDEELPESARHTSERERRASDAERELLQWKKVRFMTDKVGDEFDGYVTGVAPFGLFVELTEHFVEGLVHISTMADDYYRFLDKTHTLRGENTKKTYRLGDPVRVQVTRVDLEHRQIELGLVDILESVRLQEDRRRRPRSERPKGGTARATRPGRRERQHRKTGRR
jgi:ribonuclease R